MGKVKVSRKLRMAAKGSDTPNYRCALKLGMHPSMFSKLITGAEPVSRNDERVLAIASELGVSAAHPIKPAEGPKLVLAEKETPQSQQATTELTLGQHIAAVLDHPDTPKNVYNALAESVTDLQRRRSAR